jgi:hypothetical protein
LKDKKAEYMKIKKFEKMRQKLNKELKGIQGQINRQMLMHIYAHKMCNIDVLKIGMVLGLH